MAREALLTPADSLAVDPCQSLFIGSGIAPRPFCCSLSKCLYYVVPVQGWWMYELCFLDSITQFHMAENQQVDWVISLGHFASADWSVRNTTDAALFPKGTQVGCAAALSYWMEWCLAGTEVK